MMVIFHFGAIVIPLQSSVFLGILTGCQVKHEIQNSSNVDGYCLQDVGEGWVHLMEKPRQIICTSVTVDEILLDLVSHDRMIGEVGDSSEYMVSLSPDLIILSDNQAKKAETFENTGVPVFVYRSVKVISEIPQVIRTLGEAIGEYHKAKGMVGQLEKRRSDVQRKANQIPKKKRKRGMTVPRFSPIGGRARLFMI